jgi:hypothetical protein
MGQFLFSGIGPGGHKSGPPPLIFGTFWRFLTPKFHIFRESNFASASKFPDIEKVAHLFGPPFGTLKTHFPYHFWGIFAP